MSLRKIVIYAFEDENHSGKEVGKFEVPINPENYKRSHQITLENSQNTGSQSNNSKHSSTPPEDLSLEFVLDNTNTVEGNTLNGTPVSKQVKSFLELTYKMNGKIRKPNFLKIVWADDFVFDCQLAKADVNYTLFKPDGTPLRAKISATFKEHQPPRVRVNEEGKESKNDAKTETLSGTGNSLPDLIKTTPASSTLMNIAKANDMANMRKKLDTATQIIVPAAAKANALFDQGVNLAKTAANDARNVAQDAANSAKNAQSVLDGASGVLKDLKKGDLKNALKGAKETAKTAQNAINSAQNAANNAKKAAENAKESAQKAKSSAQDTAKTARNTLNSLNKLF